MGGTRMVLFIKGDPTASSLDSLATLLYHFHSMVPDMEDFSIKLYLHSPPTDFTDDLLKFKVSLSVLVH